MIPKIKNLVFLFLTFCSCIFTNANIIAQEIDFGSYSSAYSVTLSELTATDLEFGLVIQGEGIKNIEIADSKVIELEGVKYLDVITTITADEYLLLDSNPSCATNVSCRIPFALEAGYANRGQNNVVFSVPMNVASNVASAQFPIRYRGSNPPGPPPTPVYEGYNPALYNDTAYIYIYGSITVGFVDAGSYSANISVQVSYD